LPRFGSSASADFSFINAITLQIILSETTPTPTSSITGSDAILTSIGFLLPDAAVVASSGSFADGSVTINVGSQSEGFSGGSFGAGSDVSGEWGAAVGGEKPMDSVGNFDFVSVNTAQVTPFSGANLDGPTGLDGPQGGLLDDSAARGGLGVIDYSVIISLILDANPSTSGNQDLTAAQQAAFLSSLSTDSIVEYGSNAAFGRPGDGETPIPEPSTLLLFGTGLIGVAGFKMRFRQ